MVTAARLEKIQVVQDLGQSGYLETVRGRNGGIRLRMAPQDINLGALVRHSHRRRGRSWRCSINTLADAMARRQQLHRLFAGAAAPATGTRS